MEIKKCLFVGFKGMKNSSCVLVSELLKESPLREDGVKCETRLDVKLLSETLTRDGVENIISETPTQYLCNEAYWYALQKFEGKAIFIHIPTLKNINENLISKMKEFKNYGILDGTFKSSR